MPPGSPADFGKVIVGEPDKWAEVIKFAGISRTDLGGSCQYSIVLFRDFRFVRGAQSECLCNAPIDGGERPLRVTGGRRDSVSATDGLPSAADTALQRSELAKSVTFRP